MKKLILAQAIAAMLLAPAQAVLAADVTGLTTFSAGTPAVASQVNGNFTAVKSAVDNNHARITTLESGAASPNITGNITLVNSTATAGNILKSGVPFLHDFGSQSTFLGENAGNFTMTGGNNTAIGWRALSSNTTGINNTANGTAALTDNTTGTQNTANGSAALKSNTTGVSNTASGVGALHTNTIGGSNTASGVSALGNNTTGNNNTAIGLQALVFNTTGNNNTASGWGALVGNTTGTNNIAIGFSAGTNLTTGDNNIAIGNQGVAGESATIRIGSAQTRTFIDAIRGVTTGNANAVPVVIDSAGQLGTVSSSQRFKDDIADMGDTSSVLRQLRPVTFHYKSDQNPKGRTLQYGLVAEEVAKVAPNLVAHSANGEIETVFYQHLTPMLLNEYQKQQRVIEAQAAELAKQAAVLTKQTDRVAALEKQAQEIVALRQELARMAAVVARLGQPEKVASAGR